MMNNNTHITVFEHQSIKLNQTINGVKFNIKLLNELQSYYGNTGVPYFSLIHNGVKFNEYVGVIQIGKTVIEVLPKLDNTQNKKNENWKWRDLLINMLFFIGIFKIHAPSISSLKLRHNYILDLYFEIFIKEVEFLIHKGLIKQYRKIEGNVTALKGNILFGKNIQQNLIHKERFYVRYTTINIEHILHFIILKTIKLIKQLNTSNHLHSRINSLLLYFPDMPDIRVSENLFEKITFNRKTLVYKNSIEISKMLLLRYHPDLSMGKNNVLALMFDMNKLWEQFVIESLRKNKSKQTTIKPHISKYFWKTKTGYRSKIIPDIVINNKDKDNCIVLDTKWKNLNGYNPSPADLKQMYVYHKYFSAKKVALIYPSTITSISSGVFLNPTTGEESFNECSVILLSINTNIRKWQKEIYCNLNKFLEIEKQKEDNIH